MDFFSGKYRKLEMFLRAEENQEGLFVLSDDKEILFTHKTCRNQYHFLDFLLEKEKTYHIFFENITISQMYLSGHDDILDSGILYLMINNKPMEQFHIETILDTPFREQYHFTPFVNWCNDPNGLCWHQGYYHLFYQSNPHEQKWGNMHWGHAVSKDLIHWKHLPFALKPQEEILESNNLIGGAFSGCAISQNEELRLFFTRDIEEIGRPETIRQSQWTAVSKDGIHFTNEKELLPALSLKGADVNFRDPKVFFRDGNWYMVIASNYNGKGTVLLYKSEDLEEWRFSGPLFQLDADNVPSLECPDFFEIDGMDILMAAVMGIRTEHGVYQPVQYYLGKWEKEHFSVEKTDVCDFGGNFYAVQTFLHQDRRILLGWICDWSGEQEVAENGVYGSLTLPRILTVQNGTLYQKPAIELYDLAAELLFEETACTDVHLELEENNYYSCIEFSKGTPFEIIVAEDAGKFLKLIGNGKQLEIISDKNKDSKARYIAEVDCITSLEIFMDRRVLEVYINHGEKVGTKLFISHSRKGIFHAHFEDAKGVSTVLVKNMKAIWKEEECK